MVCRSAWRTLIVYNLYVVLSFLILYQHILFLAFLYPGESLRHFIEYTLLMGSRGTLPCIGPETNGLGHFKGP